MASVLQSPGLALYAVPALWVVSMAPHLLAVSLSTSTKDVPDYTNTSPRAWTAKVASLDKQTLVQQRILRAEGASLNGFESFPFYLGAVLAAHFARLPIATINTSVIFYVASRIAYNLLYVSITTETVSRLRSVTFLAGVFANFSLLIRAGRALAAERF